MFKFYGDRKFWDAFMEEVTEFKKKTKSFGASVCGLVEEPGTFIDN